MCTRFLLLIFTLLVTVQCDSWWNTVADFLDINTLQDAHLNITQLTFKYGYHLEEHQVVTEDSYIINCHRIPNANGQVVFLMHGITASADSWLLQGPQLSLGYVLADQGFDVWMGNARGSIYSSEHLVYNTTSPEYWKFTWEEIGLYDLAAMIDYILNTTRQNSLYYVGHSQGTTTGYVLLSMKPEYNQKIKLMFSLAPVAWMGNTKSSPLQMLSPISNELVYLLNHENFPPGIVLLNRVSPLLCHWFPTMCESIVSSLMGFENKINASLWPVIFGHMYSGSSSLQILHYGQLVKSKRFCRFDFGENENFHLFGQVTPPDYAVDMIQTPIILYYSDKDWLSDTEDVIILKSKLRNVLDNIFLRGFGHMDYIYASEARTAIYDRIIAQIRKFETDNA